MKGHERKQKASTVCRSQLSDEEYMRHMIPHHQVAIDISKLMLTKSKWDRMQEILYKIIWVQGWEIAFMKSWLEGKPSSSSKIGSYRQLVTKGTKYPPNVYGLSTTFCDPLFFDPNKHNSHLEHMQLTDDAYIQHMVPHHQVAVDMSKKILQTTKNDAVVYLANRIIKSQEAEIITLNALKTSYKYESTMFLTA